MCFTLHACNKSTSPPSPEPPTNTPLTEEAKSKTGAVLISTEEYEKIPAFVAKQYKGGRILETTATSVSLDMPPIGDQGTQGSCVGWSAAYALRSYLYHAETKKSYKKSDGSNDNSVLFSPAFVYNQLNGGIDRGMDPFKAFKLLRDEGVCSLEDMPYSAENGGYLIKPTDAQKQKAQAFKITNFGRTVISTESFKALLSVGIPIYVTGKANLSLFTPEKSQNEYFWTESGTVLDNGHGMVVVGYDDNRNAFKLMNSWGTSWANAGYIWMDYELTKRNIIQALVAVSSSLQSQIMPYVAPEIEATYSGTWKQKSSPPVGYVLERALSFAAGNNAYFIGRENNTQQTIYSILVYDIANDKWTVRSKTPSFDSSLEGGFVIGKKLYLITSSNTAKNLIEYDFDSEKWTQKKPLSFDVINGKTYRRYIPVGFTHEGKGYYGFNPENISYTASENALGAELWEYDSSNDSWKKKTSMPVEWATGGSKVYGMISGKFYLSYAESTTNYGNGSTLIYSFDMTSGAWERTVGKISKINEFGGVLNDRIYLGLTRDRRYSTPPPADKFYNYNIKTDKWFEVKPGPVPDRSANLSFVSNNVLYVGYRVKGNDYDNTLWEYKP